MVDKNLTKNKQEHNNHYSCTECCTKIPPSNKGIAAEIDDYVLYFCGDICYKEWKNRTGCCNAKWLERKLKSKKRHLY